VLDWLGNAWGGHVGVLFAAAHPQRCRTLTAIGAPIHAYSEADRRRTRLLSLLYLAAGARPVSGLLVDALLDTLVTPTMLTTGPDDPMWTTTAARAAAFWLPAAHPRPVPAEGSARPPGPWPYPSAVSICQRDRSASGDHVDRLGHPPSHPLGGPDDNGT